MDFTGDDGLPQRTTGVLGALGARRRRQRRPAPRAHAARRPRATASRCCAPPAPTSTRSGASRSPPASRRCSHPGDAEPDATAVDEDGLPPLALARSTTPSASRAISDAVGSALVVLADGHHRFETANTYRRERRAAGIDDPGADAIMTLVVELAPDQLCVRADPPAAHRRRRRRPPRRARRAVRRATPPGPTRPRASPRSRSPCATSGGLGLVDRDGLALLMPDRRARGRAWPSSRAELRDVDSARFDAGVLPAVPGRRRSPTATTPRPSPRRSTKGDADAAVLLRPVTVDTIRAAAAADLRMPEKTTFFAPEAAHRHGVPQPRRTRSLELVDFPGGAGADELGEVAGALTLRRASTSWRCTSAS